MQVKSRWYVTGHHFTIAAGFFLGPLVMQHFLPSAEHNDAVCNTGGETRLNDTNLNQVQAEQNGLAFDLSVPFYIFASVELVSSIAYLLIHCLAEEMPGMPKTI